MVVLIQVMLIVYNVYIGIIHERGQNYEANSIRNK